MNGPPPERRRDLALALVGLAAATVLLAWNAGSGSLLPSDDAIYAQAAREALRDGRVLGATWQGAPLFEKGPVLQWALMASQAAFGEGEAALRLPGILAGIALLALLGATARAAGMGRWGAAAATMVALSLNAFYFNARRPMTDVPGLALGLGGFLLVAFGPPRRTRALAGGALLGLSLMTKLVAPAPFVLALLFLQADRAFRRPAALAWAALGGLAVAAPWHLAMTAAYGGAFWDTYLGYHLLHRAGSTVVGAGRSDTYLEWLFAREGLGAAVGLVGLAWTAVVRGRPAARVALALAAGGLLPLLASSTALPHYLVSLVPGVALGGALFCDDVDRRSGTTVLVRRVGLAVAAALLVGAFAWTNGNDLRDPDYGPGTRDACAAIEARGDLPRLAGTFDLHDPAVPWYCHRDATFFVADPATAAVLRSIPMLGAAVRDLDVAGLLRLASEGALLVTRAGGPEQGLRDLAREAGVPVRTETFGSRVVATLGR